MNATKKTHDKRMRDARFVISLFALVAVCAAATAAQQSPTKEASSTPPGPQASSDSRVRVTFVLKTISDGTLCPIGNLNCENSDIWWKNFTLLASNGHALDLMSIPYPSVARSKKAFDSTVKSADKIIRRDLEMNSKGEQVGERALGFFPEIKDTKPRLGVPHYKLFWMRGTNYWVITGEHLEDVLALEERLKEEGVNAVWGWRANFPLRPV